MNTELNRKLSFARSPRLCPLPKLRFKTAITQTTGVFFPDKIIISLATTLSINYHTSLFTTRHVDENYVLYRI